MKAHSLLDAFEMTCDEASTQLDWNIFGKWSMIILIFFSVHDAVWVLVTDMSGGSIQIIINNHDPPWVFISRNKSWDCKCKTVSGSFLHLAKPHTFNVDIREPY